VPLVIQKEERREERERRQSGVDHPYPSSARVKERVELYLYSPSGPSWPVLGRTLPFKGRTGIKKT
jgi:hypothetical protein